MSKIECKQLSDTVTERKNLLPNSDLRAERDCTPTHSHVKSYGISSKFSGSIILGGNLGKSPEKSGKISTITIDQWKHSHRT